jgi:hypothetical protein
VGIEPCTTGWQTKILLTTGYAKHTIYIQYDPNVHLSKVRVAFFAKSNKRPTSIVFDVFSWETNTNGVERVSRGDISLHRLHRNQLLLASNLCSRPYQFHGPPEPQEQPLLRYLLLSLREIVFGVKHRKPEL